MKLITCILLVILEEYQCDPCLDWLFGRRSNNNNRETKLSVGLGFTAKAMISGKSEHKEENGQRSRPSHPQYSPYKSPSYQPNWLDGRPRYHIDYPHHGYPSYRQNELGDRPSYPHHPYYPPSMYPSHRTRHSTQSGRLFDATYNIPYGKQGGVWNSMSQYGTSYHRGSYGPQYNRPRYETLYPTPIGTAHQTQNVAPSASSYGAPIGSPAQISPTPAETGDGTSQRKQFFVTPTGIQQSPAQPVDIAS